VTVLLSKLQPSVDVDAAVDRVGAVAALTNRPNTPQQTTRAVGRWTRRATAATIGALVLSGAVGAAAATGVLPGVTDDSPTLTTTAPATGSNGGNGSPSDRDGRGRSGDASDGSSTTTADAASTTTVPGTATPVGPDPTAARQGLCQAFGARTEAPGKSVAAANLAAAATTAGQTVAEFCADGSTTSSAPSTTAVPGKSGSAPGQTGSTPGQSGSTPGQSGSAPGQTGSTGGQSGSAPGQAKASTTTVAPSAGSNGQGNADAIGGGKPS
jgi:hypothetical protein